MAYDGTLAGADEAADIEAPLHGLYAMPSQESPAALRTPERPGQNSGAAENAAKPVTMSEDPAQAAGAKTSEGKITFKRRMEIRRLDRQGKVELDRAKSAALKAERTAAKAAKQAPKNWEEANGALQRVTNGSSRRLNSQTTRAMSAQKAQKDVKVANEALEKATAKAADAAKLAKTTRPAGFFGRMLETVVDNPATRFAGRVLAPVGRVLSPVAKFAGRIAEPVAGAFAGYHLGHTLGTDSLGERIGRKLGGETGARIGHFVGKWGPAAAGVIVVGVGVALAAVPTAIVVGVATGVSVGAVVARDAYHRYAHGGNFGQDVKNAWQHPMSAVHYAGHALNDGFTFKTLDKDYWHTPLAPVAAKGNAASANAPKANATAKPVAPVAAIAPTMAPKASPESQSAPSHAAQPAASPKADAKPAPALPALDLLDTGLPAPAVAAAAASTTTNPSTASAAPSAAVTSATTPPVSGLLDTGLPAPAIAASGPVPASAIAPTSAISTAALAVPASTVSAAAAPLSDAAKTQIAGMVQDLGRKGADSITIESKSPQENAAVAAKIRKDGYKGDIVTTGKSDPNSEVIGRYSLRDIKTHQAQEIASATPANPASNISDAPAPPVASSGDNLTGINPDRAGLKRQTNITESHSPSTADSSPPANADSSLLVAKGEKIKPRGIMAATMTA